MSYPAQSGMDTQQTQQPQSQPVQAVVVPYQGQAQVVAIPVIGANAIQAQSRASSVFRVWCCNLVFALITLISGFIEGGGDCSSVTNNNSNSSTTTTITCNAWQLYAPAIAFGGALTILSIAALRALRCNGCSYNMNIASYDQNVLRPVLWLACVPSLGLFIWSIIYLLSFNILSVILFPFFVPCWAGLVVGILGFVQVCCCQRQFHAAYDQLQIVGNAPPNVSVQSQFVQQQVYNPQQQYGQQYAPQQQYGQQYAPQQQYGQQPQYFAPNSPSQFAQQPPQQAIQINN